MGKQVETSIMVLGAVWGGGAGFRLEGLGFWRIGNEKAPEIGMPCAVSIKSARK